MGFNQLPDLFMSSSPVIWSHTFVDWPRVSYHNPGSPFCRSLPHYSWHLWNLQSLHLGMKPTHSHVLGTPINGASKPPTSTPAFSKFITQSTKPSPSHWFAHDLCMMGFDSTLILPVQNCHVDLHTLLYYSGFYWLSDCNWLEILQWQLLTLWESCGALIWCFACAELAVLTEWAKCMGTLPDTRNGSTKQWWEDR